MNEKKFVFEIQLWKFVLDYFDFRDWKIITFEVRKKNSSNLAWLYQQTLTPPRVRFLHYIYFFTFASYILLVTYLPNFKSRRVVLHVLPRLPKRFRAVILIIQLEKKSSNFAWLDQETLTPRMRFLHYICFFTFAFYIVLVTYLPNFKNRRVVLAHVA